MLKLILLFTIGISIGVIGTALFGQPQQIQTQTTPNQALPQNAQATPAPKPTLPPVPANKTIPALTHIYQSFNNCGPATLSMNLSYWGIQVSQTELGIQLRPYQNPQGDNDDKSVDLDEFVIQAEKYGLVAYYRPNGSIDLLKQFIANDIPVVVRTFITTKEDIGHYRIVRGYDDNAQITIQDDSYHGPNLGISYQDLNTMWQPFNYEFVVLAPKEKQQLVETILADILNEKTAWQNAAKRAQKESELDPTNPYPIFNLSVAYTHLMEYQKAVEYYEQVRAKLPFRMLWYQIEPIKAYKGIGDSEAVFSLTNNILNNHNRAFSELYLIRGEVYLMLNNQSGAKQEFEKALLYNKNLEAAKQALEKLG